MAKSLRSKSQRKNRDIKRSKPGAFRDSHNARLERLSSKLNEPKPKRERTPPQIVEEVADEDEMKGLWEFCALLGLLDAETIGLHL